jgi:hypothetical protein
MSSKNCRSSSFSSAYPCLQFALTTYVMKLYLAYFKTLFDYDVMHYAGNVIMRFCTLRLYLFIAEVVLFIVQLSTITNIHQLFYGGEICSSSFYYLYKWLFYVGLIVDSGSTCRTVKRLLTVPMD